MRGEPVSFDVLFSGGRYLLTVIGAALLLGLLLVGLMAVPGGLVAAAVYVLRGQQGAGPALAVVFVVFLIGLFIYGMARLMQYYFLIIDQDAGVVDSIQRAWELTRGRAGTIIVIFLLQIVITFAGVLALCVGLVFAVPLSNLLQVVTYVALIGPQKPAAEHRMPFTNWEEDL